MPLESFSVERRMSCCVRSNGFGKGRNGGRLCPLRIEFESSVSALIIMWFVGVTSEASTASARSQSRSLFGSACDTEDRRLRDSRVYDVKKR